jgi:mitotic spindle assembly checkpoint protein MAD2
MLMTVLFCSHQVLVPKEWSESDPKYIQDSQEVRLRSFTTKVHKVDTMVRILHQFLPRS